MSTAFDTLLLSYSSPNAQFLLEFNDVSGSTATDSSAHSQNGTINGTTPAGFYTNAGPASGMNAYSFDGSTNYISEGAKNYLSPLTIGAFVNFTSFGTGSVIMSSGGTSGGAYQWALGPSATGGINWNENNSSTTHGTSAPSGTLKTGHWYFISASYDGTTWRIYVNGALVASTADTGPVAASANLYIGALEYNGATGSFFNGLMTRPFLIPTALSRAQISALAASAGFSQTTLIGSAVTSILGD